MNLKNIISKFGHKEQEMQKVFLAVEISSETIKSSLWTVKEEKTKIIKIGAIQEWDGKNKDLLLTAVDNSISDACENLETEPQGIIFGLPKDWIKKDQIIEEKKELLKFICQKLELKPLGFVLSLEALTAYLKIKEGTPANTILINIQETQSLISLVQLGKIKEVQAVGKSENLASDVKEALMRFKNTENLPARIIIFNGSADLEKYKQQLVSFNWMEEKLSFLHFPKVETLSTTQSIEAITIAGGAEVAKSLGFKIEKKEEKQEEGKQEDLSLAEKTSAVEKTSASDLGFIADKDIAQVKPVKKKFEEKPQAKEIKEKINTVKLKTAFFKKSILNLRLLFLGKKRTFVIVLAVILIFAFISLGLIFYWNIHKAKIVLYLKPKTSEKELTIILDAEEKNTTIEGIKTINTTGEKIIGDKAKGEITIYNKTDISKNFNNETILIGANNLKFTLDEEVNVASKSSALEEEGEQIVYGKAVIKITAASIGTESNLTEGSTFTFKSYSENLYSAKTNNGLSGGTSRQIKAVSQEDIDLLLTGLKKELKEKAIAKLQKEVSSEKKVLTEEIKEKIIDKSFSAESGEEVNELELKLKTEFSAFIYNKTSLEKLVAESIKNEIPDNFVYKQEKTTIETKKAEIEKNKIELTVMVNACFIPKINFTEIKKDLLGKSLEASENYLRELPNFSNADIEITPNLLGKIKIFPRLSKNILIEIKIEE